MDRVSAGIGVRDLYVAPLLALTERRGERRVLDVLEVMIDDVVGLSTAPATSAAAARLASWRRLGARWPLLAHGTDLGIGDAAGPDPRYVGAVHAALRAVCPQWYSEHLCFLRSGELDLGHFGPVFGSGPPEEDEEAALLALSRGGAAVRAGCPCPLLLENPADVLGAPSPDGERLGRAFGRALCAAGAGALLDLTNLVLGARNDGYDAGAFLHALPWERVVQVHLAGGHERDGLWTDSHSRAVDGEALVLLEAVARRAPNLRAVIIERDEQLPPLEDLLAEVEAVRRALGRAGRA